MPYSTEVVTKDREARTSLPAWLAEGAALVLYLEERGVLAQVAERLRVNRQGGYAGFDAFVFLVYMFGAGTGPGIKSFYERNQGFVVQMAALAGRSRLPSTSSMSRILSRVDVEVVRQMTHWLLLDGCGAQVLLAHESTGFRDARGERWQIFDYDGTRKAFRQRALPEGEEFPPPIRLSDRLAVAGFQGRKRGEVVLHRSALQDRGSSLWLDCQLEPGNGDRRPELASAIKAATSACAATGQPLTRAMIRLDGEFGDVPSLTAHREAGLRCITRLNRPQLLDQADVQEAMARASWAWVPDARSGPRRSAMNLGMVTVRPGKETQRDDGTAYEPIEVRVVISRYPREGEAEHGRVIDGWQYELFAALDVDEEAWSADEVVHLYFGRTALENRFAQEDKALGLDHILSYELGGEELASVVGLFVWNLRVCQGFLMDPPPDEPPERQPKVVDVDPRPVPVSPPASAEARPKAEASSETEEAPVVDEPEHLLRVALEKQAWDQLLRRRPGWRFDPALGALVCPAEQTLSLTCVSSPRSSNSSRLLFRASATACPSCPLRSSCLSAAHPDATKLEGVSIARSEAEEISTQLSKVRLKRRKERSEAAFRRARPSGRPHRPPKGQPLPLTPSPTEPAAGVWAIHQPMLVPSRARHAFTRACASLVVYVTIALPAEKPLHPYLVPNTARRQQRRATWAEAFALYALPNNAQVQVQIEGGGRLVELYGWSPPERRTA